jgi:signal transduction histidine kinase
MQAAKIAIHGKLPLDTLLGLFVFQITQVLGKPSPFAFAWYFAAAIFTYVIFLVCLWQLGRPSLRPVWMWVLLTVQLLMVLLTQSALSYVHTVELVVWLTWRQAWKCLVLKVVACTFITYYFLIRMGTPFNLEVLGHELFFETVGHLLPFIAGYLVLRQKRARLQLLVAHRELEANQALLMESIREEERLRIENNLHDVVGHQLTTLNLHLDLALRHAQEKRSDEVQSALTIARESGSLLLSQVRATSRDLG